MALRNQPYFPLYVQDYLTDENLNMCNLKTQGVYIKVLCILHKQKEYGVILLKQKEKQNRSTCLNFATKLSKLLPINLIDLEKAIEELVEEEVLTIDGDKLLQRRMVKDNSISEKRSRAGSKGGKTTQFAKAKPKANTEDEDENEDLSSSLKESVREKVNFSDLENTQWFESILRYLQLKINLEELMKYWNQFQEGMIADNDLYRDKEDYRSHFRNWVKIQIENNEKSRTNNKGFQSDTTRAAIEKVNNGFN